MDVWCSCEDRLEAEAGYVHISFLRCKDVFWSPQMQGRGNFWPGIIEPLTTWQSQVGRHPQGSSSPTPTSGSPQNHPKIRHCVWECCPNASRHFYYSSCSFRHFHLKNHRLLLGYGNISQGDGFPMWVCVSLQSHVSLVYYISNWLEMTPEKEGYMSKNDFIRTRYDHRGIEMTFPIQTFQEDLLLYL